MVEDRWRRLVGPGMVALALLAGAGSVALAAGSSWWDPPACPGGPDELVAAGHDRPTVTDGSAPVPWYEAAGVLDSTGTLIGYRLTVGIAAGQHRLDLPVESFVAGPYGRLVVVGADDGRHSRLQAIDVAAGCAWTLADDPSVIRRATISPDGASLFEARVDRTTRADLGVWRRPMDGSMPPHRVLAPIPADERFGRTWSTEFTWSVDEDRLAVQSCGMVACRTRLLDPVSGHADVVDEPDLGAIVGLARDHLVVYRACRGYPCPLISIELPSRRRAVVSSAAGRAAVIGHGRDVRIVHQWRDGLGVEHVRSVDADGGDPVDLGTRPPALFDRLEEGSR